MSDYNVMDEIIDYLEPLVGGSDEGVAWMVFLRTQEKQLIQARQKQILLKDIFTDITKDKRLSPDTFDRLVEAVKNG